MWGTEVDMKLEIRGGHLLHVRGSCNSLFPRWVLSLVDLLSVLSAGTRRT